MYPVWKEDLNHLVTKGTWSCIMSASAVFPIPMNNSSIHRNSNYILKPIWIHVRSVLLFQFSFIPGSYLTHITKFIVPCFLLIANWLLLYWYQYTSMVGTIQVQYKLNADYDELNLYFLQIHEIDLALVVGIVQWSRRWTIMLHWI